MNKYPLISKKAEQATGLILVCMVTGCFVLSITVFSPPEPVAEASRVEAPAHKNFSSPSSTVAASDKSAAIEYLPSITEIQQMILDRGYTIKVDGMVCGACYNPDHSETQENWDLAYNDQCARPEMK